MNEFEVLQTGMAYVTENKDELVQNGFGFMMRQDCLLGYKLGLSLAKLQCVLDKSALAAIEMVSENQTIVENAGTNEHGKPMALISFPAGLDLTTILTIHTFMLSMQQSSGWNDGSNDFYSVLVS